MKQGMEENVLEMKLTKKDIVSRGKNGEEGEVEILKEMRRKIFNEDGRVGESADLTVNVQNEDASISLTKGTTRNTTFDVVDSVPTFKITFEEKTVISVSPPSPSTMCNTLQQDTSACSLETCSSDVGALTGILSGNDAKSPPTTDKKALTGHILHEISEVLDKMDLSYINKVRSEFKKQSESKKVNSAKVKDDKVINTGSERGRDRAGRSEGEGDAISAEDNCAGEYRDSEREEYTRYPIKHNETVYPNIPNNSYAASRRYKGTSSVIVKKRRLKLHEDRTGEACNTVSCIDKLFSAIEMFTPGCHIISRTRLAQLESSSSTGSDASSLDDDSSMYDSDLHAETQSSSAEELYSSSDSDSKMNDQRSSNRAKGIKTAIEDKLGIPARNYPIDLYCFCFVLFYLLWTMCYMRCTYRRTFYGVIRNSNTWYCKAYDSLSKLHQFAPDTSQEKATYKSNRKHYHPFQPW